MTPQQQQAKQEAVKAFLAKGGKVTKCQPAYVGPTWFDSMKVGTTGSNKRIQFGKGQ